MTVDHQALLKQFEYLNHMNPHTFEVEDLDRLIKSVRAADNNINTPAQHSTVSPQQMFAPPKMC